MKTRHTGNTYNKDSSTLITRYSERVHSRFDTSLFGTNRSKFVTHVKSIRYKLTLLQIVSIQNTILERTQTSVVNKQTHTSANLHMYASLLCSENT